MPELPEVETVARRLREAPDSDYSLIGHVVDKLHIFWDKTIAVPGPEAIQTRLIGQRFEGIGRRGKYIQMQLDKDWLLVHLRMSGDLTLGPQSSGFEPHDRVAIDMDNGTRLTFNDTRKFGRIWLVDDPERVVGNLGPEPFDPRLSSVDFYERLNLHRRQIKPLLLDQTFLAGVGNIYADEALFQARVHPQTLSNTLSTDQAEVLLDAIRKVLQDGIRRNGASIDWAYRGGQFQNEFQVYQRTDKPCRRCGTAIARIVVGQRGTHYCPDCQAFQPGHSH